MPNPHTHTCYKTAYKSPQKCTKWQHFMTNILKFHPLGTLTLAISAFRTCPYFAIVWPLPLAWPGFNYGHWLQSPHFSHRSRWSGGQSSKLNQKYVECSNRFVSSRQWRTRHCKRHRSRSIQISCMFYHTSTHDSRSSCAMYASCTTGLIIHHRQKLGSDYVLYT